jgi:DNA-binding LacI/PurR family transcriptional regulator/anti-anti-sigma regulatory factor
LTTTVHNLTSQAIWLGANAAARERGVNLISFAGQAVRNVDDFSAQANVLYDLVSAEHLDGLLCWTSSVGRYLDHAEMVDFLRHYCLPVVGLASPLEGIPTVVIDGYRGMREAIVHLIEVHGCRRLAFIGGLESHPYAQERYSAYTDALKEYGIPLDSALVSPVGGWAHSTGVEAIAWLMDQQGLRPGDGFDAVVAASDTPALGALEALQERGVQVPGDVALVGFNDSWAGRVATPPLTSVAAPLYEQGRQGVEALLKLLEGEEVADLVSLPAPLMIRQSCGCQSSAVVQAAVGPRLAELPGGRAGETGGLEAIWPARRKEILAAIEQAVELFAEAANWAEQLLDAFFAALMAGKERAPEDIFLPTLDRVLRQALAAGDDVAIWQGAISALRRYLLPHLDGEALLRAEDLWQQARVMIGEVQARAWADRQLQAEQQAQTLRGIGQVLITTFDVEGLTDILASRLPQLGIPSGFVSLYEDPANPAQQSRLVLAYGDDGRTELETGGLLIPSPQLAPQGMWPQRQYSYIVQSLYFQKDQIGFVLFEVGPQNGSIYWVLRGEISSALQGALLMRARVEAEAALEEAYARVEQQVRERTAELEQEIEERERAQAESIRLQQEVIEAQQLALQELSTPIIPVMEGIIIMPLIGSIDTLRARDVTRSLLAGIREHSARVVILDITGVPVVDSGVAAYLNRTIQAARLKGARTIVTGISEAVAETIVDLGVDWSGIETLRDLRTGLRAALARG